MAENLSKRLGPPVSVHSYVKETQNKMRPVRMKKQKVRKEPKKGQLPQNRLLDGAQGISKHRFT